MMYGNKKLTGKKKFDILEKIVLFLTRGPVKKSRDIESLVAEQERDRKTFWVKPRIINPVKVKPYDKVKDLELRAIFILHKAKFSYRKIGHFFKKDKNTISSIVSKVYASFPEYK